jgi:hypothetical protein
MHNCAFICVSHMIRVWTKSLRTSSVQTKYLLEKFIAIARICQYLKGQSHQVLDFVLDPITFIQYFMRTVFYF